MTGRLNSNAHPSILAETGVGATKETIPMPGNRNSGRRPAPPCPEDAISELLIDMQEQVASVHSNVVRLFGVWRDVRGLYPEGHDQHRRAA